MCVVWWGIIDVWCGGVSQMCVVWWGIVDVCGVVGYHRCV